MNEVATTIIHKIKISVNTEKLSAADSRMIEWTTTEGTVNSFKTILYPNFYVLFCNMIQSNNLGSIVTTGYLALCVCVCVCQVVIYIYVGCLMMANT